MQFSALESAGFALQLSKSRFLDFEIRKFQIFRILKKLKSEIEIKKYTVGE